MKKNKKLKFNNTIIKTFDGKKAYDSKLERDYHFHLTLLEKAGEIKDIVQWPSVELLPDIRYKPDFMYFDIERNQTIWVDVKGVIGERYRIIVKLWKLFGPGVLVEAKRSRSKHWMIKEYKSKGYSIFRKAEQ